MPTIACPCVIVDDNGIIRFIFGQEPEEQAIVDILSAKGLPDGLHFAAVSPEFFRRCMQGFRGPAPMKSMISIEMQGAGGQPRRYLEGFQTRFMGGGAG